MYIKQSLFRHSKPLQVHFHSLHKVLSINVSINRSGSKVSFSPLQCRLLDKSQSRNKLCCCCNVCPQTAVQTICRQKAAQALSSSLRGVNGSFTYFTTCIEGGAGRVNDSVALHDGNVGLDNLQLQTTTTTNDRQTTWW